MKGERFIHWLNRHEDFFLGGRQPKYGCQWCNMIVKGHHGRCPRCGHEGMTHLGEIARPPRRHASQKKWKEFWRRFGRI